MAEIKIDEERLRELIEESVQKHLKLTIEDMDEVRRSPAAAIVRIETRLDAIEKYLEKNVAPRTELIDLRSRVENIEENMVTKTDLANLRTELGERIGRLGERLGRVETGQKIMFGVFLSMLSAVIAMLIKLVFFP